MEGFEVLVVPEELLALLALAPVLVLALVLLLLALLALLKLVEEAVPAHIWHGHMRRHSGAHPDRRHCSSQA